MATRLEKPVRRQMMATGLERGKYKNRGVIVTLAPGDEIAFRLKGTRQEYSCSLAHCFKLAMYLTVQRKHKDKVKEYLERRKFKKGLRRPKMPSMPSRIYADAMKAN